VGETGSELGLLYDGVEQHYDLETFRLRIRAHVREELERASTGRRAAIDLARVADAEGAAHAGDFERVAQLLGAWPAPLALFLRTPEGQALAPEARALIARALGLLGTACVKLGDTAQGEEVFRLAVQYAQDGPEAVDVFRRLGEALLDDGRPGEAIGPLRRALTLGGNDGELFLQLARAFVRRGRFVAALGCLREASRRGLSDDALADEWLKVEKALGPGLEALRVELGGGALGRPEAAAH
jgi:tetratricopeptide (TPR) repeat protein